MQHPHQPEERPWPGEPVPPPADGMLWDTAGEIRTLLTLPAATALQVAHPAVAAGVDAYSVFRTDPWGRGERSLRSLQLWVYGGERAAEEGRRLRRLHARIRGTDAHGRPYRALDPRCYVWVLATGFPVMCHAQRLLGAPYTPAQEERLYGEWLRVGRVLGIGDRDMPQTVARFRAYYAKVLAEELEETTVLRELLDTRVRMPPPDRGPAPLRVLLSAAWPVLRPPFLRLRRFVTVGFVPPEAREALGLEWTPRQERWLRRLGRAVGAVLPLLPERLRYLPPAREARAAHRAAHRGAGPRADAHAPGPAGPAGGSSDGHRVAPRASGRGTCTS